MNSFAVIAFFTCVAAANASAGGLYLGSSGLILQGPSSKTAVLGPDGSAIKAVAPGGQIIHEEQPGFVAQTAPVYRQEVPIYRHQSPIYRYEAPVYRHAAPAVTYTSPSLVRHVPSITYGAPVAYAAPSVAYGTPLFRSYEHEGQYAHDFSETLSDDGSYKPHLY